MWAVPVAIALLMMAISFVAVLAHSAGLFPLLFQQGVLLSFIALACIGEVVTLSGYFFCLFTPSKTGARTWIVAALSLNIVKELTRLGVVLSAGDSALREAPPLLTLAILFAVAEWVCLLIFLRAIAFARYAQWLMGSIIKLMWLTVVGTAWCIGLYFWMRAVAQGLMQTRFSGDGGTVAVQIAMAYYWLVIFVVCGEVFCALSGYIVYRQLYVLNESRYLIGEAAAGSRAK